MGTGGPKLQVRGAKLKSDLACSGDSAIEVQLKTKLVWLPWASSKG